MAGHSTFEFHLGRPGNRPLDDEPRKILIMGNFSGRQRTDSLADRPIPAVDVDNFEAIMERLRPGLSSQDAAAEQITTFTQLDDFHPDQLYRNLDLFKALRQQRQRLLDPATSAQAAAELVSSATPDSGSIQSEKEEETAMFERLLGRGPTTPVQAPAQASVDRLIQGIIAPHVVPKADTQGLISAVDQTISEQMRALLHRPDFQALESTWRGLHWLIISLETDEELKIHLLDVSKQELIADICSAGDDLQTSGLYKAVVEPTRIPGSRPWSLVVGLYSFAPKLEELNVLAGLGALASQAGGPFLAAAEPEMLGCRSSLELANPNAWQANAEFEEHWRNLRHSSVALWIGLLLPRMLLRLPYGKRTDPVDDFEFEECASKWDHRHYLWGNPALAAALVIGRNWSWDELDLNVEDLPTHTYDEDGETKMQACAEVYLSEQVAGKILDRGIMPLLSYRNRNMVRLARLQSLADPPTGLI